MKKLFLLLAVTLLFSCAQKGVPIESAKTPQGSSIAIELLFEIDGVRVYRFYDHGYARYFTTGQGNFQGQTQITSSGKSVSIHYDGVLP